MSPSKGDQVFLMGKRSKLLGVLRSKKGNATHGQDEVTSISAQLPRTEELPQSSERSSVLQKLLSSKTKRPPTLQQVQKDASASNEVQLKAKTSTIVPISPEENDQHAIELQTTPPQKAQKTVTAANKADSDVGKPPAVPKTPEEEERDRMARRATFRGIDLTLWRTSPDVVVRRMSYYEEAEDDEVIFWVLRQLHAVDKGKWECALTATVEACVGQARGAFLYKVETMNTVQGLEHQEFMNLLGKICASHAVTSWLERRGLRNAAQSENTLRWALRHSKRGNAVQCQRITNQLVLEFARWGDLQMLKVVVEHGGDISPGNVSENGDTALHLAAARGHSAIVRYLLAQGANGHVKNSRNWTPKHSAGENGHEECFFILHEKLNPGTVPLVEGVNVATSSRRSSRRGYPRREDFGDDFRDRLGAYDRPLPGGGADPRPLRGPGDVIPMRYRPFEELRRRMNGDSD
jgi:hypothetical protein